MDSQLQRMEQGLSNEDRLLLEKIYAPQVVAIPPVDACRSMCVTPDGEIRIYGAIEQKSPEDVGTQVYIASRDCGLSWKMHLVPEGALGSASLHAESGRYISVFPNEFNRDWSARFSMSGTWAVLSDEGYDSTNYRFVKLSDKAVHVLRLPFYLASCGRWLVLGEYRLPDMSDKLIVLFYSDDDGETWTERVIEKSAPYVDILPHHKGLRWQEYSCEPTVVELSSGELVMLVRTSHNYHYMYRSLDKGETWSGPEPSCFHGTITMPTLHKLSDGRILFCWCNTQPMPELDHREAFPPLGQAEINGIWEDVFTNRDANHLAISGDDMQSWVGFRELFLNPIRSYADFRATGGIAFRDKSVHQMQMLELPCNKLLIHFGQNPMARRVVILDIDWLYERSRTEDLRLGLANLSTHMYVKSNLGGYRGFSGHCAYNRTHGALLVPDPDGNFEEALQVCRIEDERLVYKKQGVVWNFPASHAGQVTLRLRVLGQGVRICLTDRWYNPADETVALEAPVSCTWETPGGWVDLRIVYDLPAGKAIFFAGDVEHELALQGTAPNGLSYLHVQTLAESEDQQGTLIKYFRQQDAGEQA
ncbi:MAG: exo-alpha-sialidase [Clostridia bacterium]|nr:exo-alpha-sialidase [Clostridia bacterium]